jgi:hypothetical protein
MENLIMPTPNQNELDAINAAVAASGAVRTKKVTRFALEAWEAGLCTQETVGSFMAAQRIKNPEMFEAKPAKPSSNPWSPNFPDTPLPGKTTTKQKAIGEFIAQFGTAAAARMQLAASRAAGQELDIAGRATGRSVGATE